MEITSGQPAIQVGGGYGNAGLSGLFLKEAYHE